MNHTTRLFALFAATLMVMSALSVGAVAADSAANTSGNLSISVTQDDGVTVSVTENDSAVENASVNVSSENGTYVGDGSYETDENGTVNLPVPEENVTVTVTAAYENETVSTTVDLLAANETEDDGNESDAFGQQVSSFVHGVLTDGTQGPPGLVISDFVVANNPGNATPPAFDENATRGPPADVGPDGDETRGPPENAGPSDDADEEEEEDDDEESDDSSPSEDRGNGNGR